MTSIPLPEHSGTGLSLPPPGLTWGIKRSFVKYLSYLPDAAVSAADGADIVNGSFFNFAPDGGDFDPSTGLGTLQFKGDVRLSGHGGMMRVRLLNPWVTVTGAGAELGVSGHASDTPSRIPTIPPVLAELSAGTPLLTEGRLLWLDLTTRLSADGTGVFNDQYPLGQEMDPLFIHVPGPADP